MKFLKACMWIMMITMLISSNDSNAMALNALRTLYDTVMTFNCSSLVKISKDYWVRTPSWVKYSTGGFLIGSYLIWDLYKKKQLNARINKIKTKSKARIDQLSGRVNTDVANLQAGLSTCATFEANFRKELDAFVSLEICEPIKIKVCSDITNFHMQLLDVSKKELNKEVDRVGEQGKTLTKIVNLVYEKLDRCDEDVTYLWGYIFPKTIEHNNNKYKKEKRSKGKEKQEDMTVKRRRYPQFEREETLQDLIRRLVEKYYTVQIKTVNEFAEEMNDSDFFVLVTKGEEEEEKARRYLASAGIVVADV